MADLTKEQLKVKIAALEAKVIEQEAGLNRLYNASKVSLIDSRHVLEATTEELNTLGRLVAIELHARNNNKKELLPVLVSDAELRAGILAKATEYVCKDRNSTYGTPEQSFQTIANLWNGFMDAKDDIDKFTVTSFQPYEVALMLGMVKMARLMSNPYHMDSWIDLAGYSACGGGIQADKEQKHKYNKAVMDRKAEEQKEVSKATGIKE